MAPPLLVAHNARTELQAVARAHATPPSLAFRARLVLRAAELDRPTNRTIGPALGGANLTVGQGRRRSLALGFPGRQDALRSGRPRTIASPTRVQVISVARALPQDHERTVTRWTLDAIVATLLDALHTDALSRSSIWRLLHDVALKPHTRASWLNSHDEDCEAKAPPLCPRDIKALDDYAQGRLVICGDAKTGRPVLERQAPTTPAQPGRRERREHAAIRPGTRVLSNALAGATGQMAWTIGRTRTATDCVAPLPQAYQRLPRLTRYAWGLDH